MKLSWTSGSNVRGYFVQRSFDGSTYTTIAEYLLETSFLDSPNARGKSAYYIITAVNGEGDGVSIPEHSEVVAGKNTPTNAPTTSGGETQRRGGPQNAAYNEALGVPSCAIVGSSCKTNDLIDGKNADEPNQPNTLDTCKDGTKGEYQSDESIDAIIISSDSGEDMSEGSAVTVTADAWCWDTGKKDFIYFYHASDASNPNWTLMERVQCTGGSRQTLSTSYTLPKGTQQAVRVSIRYQSDGSASQGSCGFGSYDDNDDVVIQVKEDLSFQGTVDARATEDNEVESSTNSDQPVEKIKKQHEAGERKRKQQLRKNGSRA